MVELKQIGQGRTADVYDFQEDKVLKLFKKDFPIEAINQEYNLSKNAYSLGLSTPCTFEMIDHDNRKGIIYQKITGSTLLSQISKNPFFTKKYSKIFATVHHNLHSKDDLELEGNQKKILTHNIQSTSLLNEEEKNKIIKYIDQLPDGNKLCHGDFHPDNIIAGNEYWIIDWMTGMIGHPSGDVARTVILLSYGTMPEGTPRLILAVINFIRKRINKEYIRQYLKQSQQDYIEIDKWILPVAAARLTEWIPPEEKNKLLLVIRERLNAMT